MREIIKRRADLLVLSERKEERILFALCKKAWVPRCIASILSSL